MKYIAVLFILLSLNLCSQDTISKPKVALVLSGGVAKGLAHIGVLKVLEEEGIKPDIIVGTSMGAIIGGLYSIGYSADEIEKITLNTDWYKYLSNDTDLRNLNIEEKDDFEEYMYDFPVKKKKPSLGKGLIFGHELELYLNKLTFSAYKYSSFNEFPIKFRALATDVINSQSYVFEDGSLALALRTSMSIPTLFEPTSYKGKMLVDGGILDNFGVDVALKNGADIIIGSSVERVLKDEKQFDSYKNMISILLMIESKNKYKKYKDSVDILIEPPVVDMGIKFEKTQEIIDLGYLEAKSHSKEFELIKKKMKIVNHRSFNKTGKPKTAQYKVSKIAIRGIDDVSYKYVIYSRLRNNIGTIATHWSIEKEITDLYRSGQFNYIKYYIEKIAADDYKLIFIFSPKAKTNLQLGIDYNENAGMGIMLGMVSRNILFTNSKFKIKARVSKFPKVDEYYINYLNSNRKLALKQSFSYVYNKLPIYTDDYKITSYARNYFTGSLSGLYISSNNSMWELGLNHSILFYKKLFKTELDSIRSANFTTSKVYLKYLKNTLNDKYFPVRGNKIVCSSSFNFSNLLEVKNTNYEEIISNPKNYVNLEFKWDNYTKINKKFVSESSFYGEFNSLTEKEFVLKPKTIGGVSPDNKLQTPFWGLPNNYLISSNMFIINTGIRYKLTEKIYLKASINSGVFDHGDLYNGGVLSFIFDSPIGPISLSVAKSFEYYAPQFHISLGHFR